MEEEAELQTVAGRGEVLKVGLSALVYGIISPEESEQDPRGTGHNTEWGQGWGVSTFTCHPWLRSSPVEVDFTCSYTHIDGSICIV